MRTFKLGGIHPEENKLAKYIPVEPFPLPKEGVVFITQHLGAPAVPLVQKGDKVKVGQLIAKAEAFICANTHSPYSGIVTKVDLVTNILGYKRMAVTIEVEGDEWAEGIDTSPELKKEITLSKDEIIQRIKDCGIVGLGGARFPTHIKYMIPPDKKVDYVIINAAECEPYITSDHRVMLERGEECMVGIQALMIAAGAKEARIGIEENKKDAIEYLSRIAENYPGIKVFGLKAKYPQGAEKQLIKALTGREVPNGKLPIEIGCIVNNISTSLAVYEAVQKNKPLVEVYTTVSGKNLVNCKNYKIRIGTSYQAVFDSVGGIPPNTGKIIVGGPMMGKSIAHLGSYLTKGKSSVLFLDTKESKRKDISNCLRCGKCVSVCPMGLEPYLLQLLALRQRLDECEKNGIMNCMECGSCSFTCPSNRPLLDRIRAGKLTTSALIRARSVNK